MRSFLIFGGFWSRVACAVLGSGLLFDLALASNPISFTYQGKLTAEDGVTPLAVTVDLKLQIFDPSGTCLLYEESQSGLDLSASQGFFNVQVGSEVASSKRGVADPGHSMVKVFTNTANAFTANASCLAGYTPQSGDKRRLKVTVKNLNSGVTSTLTPMFEINATPYSMLADKALDANSLQSKVAADFLQVSAQTTQTKVDQLTQDTFFNKLVSLTNDYQTPSSCSSGNFNRWNGTAWVCEADQNSGGGGGGTVTSVSAAATAGNPISIGGTATAPTVDIGKATTSTSGYLSSADWNTFNSKLTSITSGNVTSALGYTPQQQNTELTALAGISATGVLKRTGAGAYSSLGVNAPIVDSGTALGLAVSSTGGLYLDTGSLAIKLGSGLTVNGSNQLSLNYGTTADTVAQGNDSRIVNAVQTNDARLPASVCATGFFNRWNGSAWVCEADQSSGGGGGGSSVAWVYNPQTVLNASAVSTNTWYTMDLSSTVGAGRSLVMIRVSPSANCSTKLRPNGATYDIGYNTTSNMGGGLTGCTALAGNSCMALVFTDADGKIQYSSNVANNLTLELLAHFPSEISAPAANYASAFAYRSDNLNYSATQTYEDIPLTGGNSGLVNATHSTSTNPERITVSAAGIYQITFKTQHNTGSTLAYYAARLLKNGTTEIPGSFCQTYLTSASGPVQCTSTVIVSLAANDYVQIQAAAGGGTTLVANRTNINPLPTTQVTASLSLSKVGN